jgi:competence protein ComEA
MQYLSALARHWIKIIAGGMVLLGILIVWQGWQGGNAAQASSTLPLAADQADQIDEGDGAATPDPTVDAGANQQVVVYISGAVRAPDVYQLPKDARIKDLVLAAGGFADDADPAQINLAERLGDAQHIHVPRQGDPAAPSQAGAAPDSSGGQLIDINTASAAELDGLPGVGQAIAQRIVDYRTTNGPFKAAEELQKVKGIGPALFAKIAALITAGP